MESPAKTIDDFIDQINLKETENALSSNKYIQFKEWLNNNNFQINPKIQFPTVFGEDMLIGFSAKEIIQPKELLLRIPVSKIITKELIRNSDLKPFFEKNPEIFVDHFDACNLLFTTYILREMTIENSFWKYYINAAIIPDLPFTWNVTEKFKCDNIILKADAEGYEIEMNEEWNLLENAMKDAANLFNLNLINKQLFVNAYSLVISRIFGTAFPTTFLAPFADSLNHAPNSDVIIEFVKTSEQKTFITYENKEKAEIKQEEEGYSNEESESVSCNEENEEDNYDINWYF